MALINQGGKHFAALLSPRLIFSVFNPYKKGRVIKMDRVFKSWLFNKNILVDERNAPDNNAFAARYYLASKLGVRIKSGADRVSVAHISFAAEMLGEFVPLPFFVGFPDTVREVSPDKFLFDQLLHYAITYGMGMTEEAGHSVFEKDFERATFNENFEPRYFSVIPEEEALALVLESAKALVSGSRPMNEVQFELVCACIEKLKLDIGECGSRDTLARLLMKYRDMKYADMMRLSDVMKLVEHISFSEYGNRDLRKLNLSNKHRKLITAVIDRVIERGAIDVSTCYERKREWCGLLHHIHYRPKCEAGKDFTDRMRGKGNESAYSHFERAIAEGDVVLAADTLLREKGSSALLRNVNYLLSRFKTEEEFRAICDRLQTDNVILLIQLLYSYRNYRSDKARCFRYHKFGTLIKYEETDEERRKRRSQISFERVAELYLRLLGNLKSTLKGRLGRVYIDEGMKRMALPIQESTSMGGYGVLARGSRIPIDIGEKKLRAFVYWEKVDDIDLSAIGITESGEEMEFSWRTAFGFATENQRSDGLLHSADQTAGYNGGSEYFDIDIEILRKDFPELRYLVLDANVFSRLNFDQCVCYAGYMLRDRMDSGEVFEPVTVKSKYAVNFPGSFAHMFAIDLDKCEFVWLNIAREGSERIAARDSSAFLLDYVNATEVISIYSFFEMMASEVVSRPEDADVVVSDEDFDIDEEDIGINGNGNENKNSDADSDTEKASEANDKAKTTVRLKEGAIQVRSRDFDKLIAYLNQ